MTTIATGPIKTWSDGTTCRQFAVAVDGSVQAYDPVAGHYTTCHSLTPRQQSALRRRARA